MEKAYKREDANSGRNASGLASKQRTEQNEEHEKFRTEFYNASPAQPLGA